MEAESHNPRHTPSGLFVTVDNVEYKHEPTLAPEDRPHLFTYHLTIHNTSFKTVTILARKWIIHYEDGEIDVVEGDKVVGKTPKLAPGKAFSYASFHLTGKNSTAKGAFHGVDEKGATIMIPIPSFTMKIPGDTPCN